MTVKTVRWRVLVALLLVGAGASACAPHSGNNTNPATPAAPVQTTPPADPNLPTPVRLTPSQKIDLNAALGSNPLLDVAATDSTMYTSTPQGVLSINRATGQSTIMTKAATAPDWLTLAGTDLWVEYPSENLLRRIRVSDGQVTAQTALGADVAQALAVTPGFVWTIINNATTLVRIDERTGAIVGRTTIDQVGSHFKAEGLTAVGNSVFVVSTSQDAIERIDSTGTVKKTWPVGFGPCTVVPDANATYAWVFDCNEHTLVRLDLATGKSTTVDGVSELIGPMVTHSGATWFTMLSADRSTTYLLRISGTGTIDKAIDVGSAYALGVFATADGLWVGADPGEVFYNWAALSS
jgi:DNA-binding beta-propeller fold protein YncE